MNDTNDQNDTIKTFNVIINNGGYVPVLSTSAGGAEHEMLDAFPFAVHTALAVSPKSKTWADTYADLPRITIRNVAHENDCRRAEKDRDEMAEAEDERLAVEKTAALRRSVMLEKALVAYHDLFQKAASALRSEKINAGALIIASADDPDGETFKTARGLYAEATAALKKLEEGLPEADALLGEAEK